MQINVCEQAYSASKGFLSNPDKPSIHYDEEQGIQFDKKAFINNLSRDLCGVATENVTRSIGMRGISVLGNLKQLRDDLASRWITVIAYSIHILNELRQKFIQTEIKEELWSFIEEAETRYKTLFCDFMNKRYAKVGKYAYKQHKETLKFLEHLKKKEANLCKEDLINIVSVQYKIQMLAFQQVNEKGIKALSDICIDQTISAISAHSYTSNGLHFINQIPLFSRTIDEVGKAIYKMAVNKIQKKDNPIEDPANIHALNDDEVMNKEEETESNLPPLVTRKSIPENLEETKEETDDLSTSPSVKENEENNFKASNFREEEESCNRTSERTEENPNLESSPIRRFRRIYSKLSQIKEKIIKCAKSNLFSKTFTYIKSFFLQILQTAFSSRNHESNDDAT